MSVDTCIMVYIYMIWMLSYMFCIPSYACYFICIKKNIKKKKRNSGYIPLICIIIINHNKHRKIYIYIYIS